MDKKLEQYVEEGSARQVSILIRGLGELTMMCSELVVPGRRNMKVLLNILESRLIQILEEDIPAVRRRLGEG